MTILHRRTILTERFVAKASDLDFVVLAGILCSDATSRRAAVGA
jgi:hypothetical protein